MPWNADTPRVVIVLAIFFDNVVAKFEHGHFLVVIASMIWITDFESLAANRLRSKRQAFSRD